jgi:hypothetical protein
VSGEPRDHAGSLRGYAASKRRRGEPSCQATRERFRNAGIELTTSGLLELPAMNGLHG